MLRKIASPCGKVAEIDTNVYLNGEIQYNEPEYECILWLVDGENIVDFPEFKDKKVLVVYESKFKQALILKELGYG